MIAVSAVLVLTCGIITILTKGSSGQVLFYIFKPLTTIIVVITAFYYLNISHCVYSSLIFTALLFSLTGDILLMFRSKFLYGLGSFLTAHIFLLLAFTSVSRSIHLWLLAFFAAAGIFIYLYLKPGLDNYKVPVILYLITILMMAWRGLEVYFKGPEEAQIICVAVLLFVISDFLIAIREFKNKFKGIEILILVTYFTSIWLLAVSPGFLC